MVHEHPWELRMEHFGFSHIQISWRGRTIHFNPISEVEEDSIIVLLGNWIEQLEGAKKTIEKGIQCTVVAAPEILTWLRQFGSFEGVESFNENGFSISLEAHVSIPSLTPKELLRKIKASVKRPVTIVQRLKEKQKIPESSQQIAWIQFPSGVLLGHLNLAIHRNIPLKFLEDIKKKAMKAQWVLVGCDYEETEAFATLIQGFSHSQILLSDLIGDYRRKIGLSTHLLTPIADEAITNGLDIQVFASKVGYRFDTIDLLNAPNKEIK